MIKPTVGRVVYYRPSQHDISQGLVVGRDRQPLDAHVVYVHGDRMVNLAGFDANGDPFKRSSVTLRQPEDEAPHGAYCEWMDYQIKQADRHAELPVTEEQRR